jgi:hypothetical protein
MLGLILDFHSKFKVFCTCGANFPTVAMETHYLSLPGLRECILQRLNGHFCRINPVVAV